ncbi:hypothetical protein B0T16DRAFT_412995 [Cercophora newfieldiana]|uniref:Uncharacterized protein n=1 Tax=Cercophora newfieldiana TaxID=92897 RepID=A0AA39Y759_9PEZI|nr:hypothetical protein B0T16DRAFT_412995 [Cercophora newfieldiana]
MPLILLSIVCFSEVSPLVSISVSPSPYSLIPLEGPNFQKSRPLQSQPVTNHPTPQLILHIPGADTEQTHTTIGAGKFGIPSALP